MLLLTLYQVPQLHDALSEGTGAELYLCGT